MNIIPLANKHYWNGVILTGKNVSLKCSLSLGQRICQQIMFRSFIGGTLSLYRSKGYKVVVCQTFRIIQLCGIWTRVACVWFNSDKWQDFFTSPTLTACSFADLWPTETSFADLWPTETSFADLWPIETHNTSLKRSKPHLLKYLLIQETSSIFKISFSLVVLGVWYSFSKTVHQF